MANQFTGTADITGQTGITNLVQTVYDRLVQFRLRNMPVHRAIADVRPRQVPMPGNAVIMQRYPDLAPATTPLTENVDPDAVAIGDTDTVQINPAEYGNAAIVTRRLNLFALSDVDPAVADIIAFNLVNSVDRVVRDVVRQGTNVTFAGGNTATNQITAADVITAEDVRTIVALLRGRAAIPRKGELFSVHLHPYVSKDLREQTGEAEWRAPHVYPAPDAIWAGEIGQFEGCFFIETNRAYSANDGEPTPTPDEVVFRSQFAGKQYLAEAVWDEFHTVIGPVVDKLKRFRPIGWTGTAGWARYREACGHRLESGSSLTPAGATAPTDQPTG